MALFAAFVVFDEVFISYAIENTHRGLFVAQLLSLLAVELLPDQWRPG